MKGRQKSRETTAIVARWKINRRIVSVASTNYDKTHFKDLPRCAEVS